MNGLIKQLAHDQAIWWGTLFSIGIIVVSLVFLLVVYRSLPPLIPLYNQLPWGVDRLSPRIGLFLPTLLGLGIIIGNSTLIVFFAERMQITARMLTLTTILISTLILVFIFRTVLLIL
ncbi:MAG TPA: hypothetical protein VG935_00490 [Patescibacteria group bacterium]|nr:hypothetical protein [Patescibacteria group bacterium]